MHGFGIKDASEKDEKYGLLPLPCLAGSSLLEILSFEGACTRTSRGPGLGDFETCHVVLGGEAKPEGLSLSVGVLGFNNCASPVFIRSFQFMLLDINDT